MVRFVYFNGRYVRYHEARVHVEDRGFQFADSVYEVCQVAGGRLIDEARHMARLERSLGELEIVQPMSPRALGLILRETIRRNRVRDGLVYLQVTRGVAPRDFVFPPCTTRPTLIVLARSIDPALLSARARQGIAVTTVPDLRWARCDLKTTMLLPACLAKQAAKKAGAQEAWFVDEAGFVTEGASSNAWIITHDRRVVTRPLGREILGGVTRRTLLDVLERCELMLEERAFRVEEALNAQEAFVTSASATVMPVVRINDRAIGTGRPGPVVEFLRARFGEVAAVSDT